LSATVDETSLNDGYGSESEVDDEPVAGKGVKALSGKKIITHNGMRALLSATEAAVTYLSSKEPKTPKKTTKKTSVSESIPIDVNATYYELTTGLELSNIKAHICNGEEAPQIIIRDANTCVTNNKNPHKSESVSAELTASMAQVWIIDTTSATQAQSNAILNEFRKSGTTAKLLCLASSGFKNEQGGADKNQYGTVRPFSANKEDVDDILAHIKTTDMPLAATSHLYRQLLKKLGFGPRNENILKPSRKEVKGNKANVDDKKSGSVLLVDTHDDSSLTADDDDLTPILISTPMSVSTPKTKAEKKKRKEKKKLKKSGAGLRSMDTQDDSSPIVGNEDLIPMSAPTPTPISTPKAKAKKKK
jgi:hypothetical protein